jgi:formiminotetrahydrofolate cyclodeaminase
VANTSLLNLTVDQFLTRLASDAPTPGGGSVAALSGALAASLGQMVCVFTVGKPKFAAVEPQVRDLAERLRRAGELFRTLIDEDAAAYDVLSAALKLDKSDPQRKERVAQAATLAGTVPLATATLSANVLSDLEHLQQLGNPLLRSDMEAAAHLAEAALQAAAVNVLANLGLMPPADAQQITAQLEALSR